MTDDRASRIAPPPSVDDVLSSLLDDSRIGKVDFTASLGEPPAGSNPSRSTTSKRIITPIR